MNDGIGMKGKRMIIHFLLQKKILWQLLRNHMGIQKMMLLVQELVYWVNMNSDIEMKKTVKQGATCLEYQWTQWHEKMISYEMSCKLREMVATNIFSINNHMLLCILDYYSKKTYALSADGLITTYKIVFTEFVFSKKIVSDTGMNLYQINLNNLVGSWTCTRS